jgi:arginine decarboxylase
MTLDIKSHLNAPKLRIDTWNKIATLAENLKCNLDKDAIAQKKEEMINCLENLIPIENYYAFPGIKLCKKIERLLYEDKFEKFYELVLLIIESLSSHTCNFKAMLNILNAEEIDHKEFIRHIDNPENHYFEVLLAADWSETQKEIFKKEMDNYILSNEKFIYELVFVNSLEDAVIAAMFNFNIKCCLISNILKYNVGTHQSVFNSIIEQVDIVSKHKNEEQRLEAIILADILRNLRQKDLDLYYLCSYEPEKSAGVSTNSFNKIFYDFENHAELHMTILQGIKSHYETPFFDALKKYTFEPKSAFHALPVARGKSVFHSRWIHDMEEFYGKNIFFAESSSTAGGLDSLLHPTGSIKHSMQKASEYFGSKRTFFVTSGTSASNKIVSQALLKPGDIVLIEHTCHESHHYGAIMTGAHPVYLNGYPIKECNILGPVSLREIKKQLLHLKQEGQLHRVKMLILTNCTFDGIVYNVAQTMEEVLAIKPDMIFLWDEAWFAYARCIPHYRMRTAMFVAASLQHKYKQSSYRTEYEQFRQQLEQQKDRDEFMLNNKLLPDPDKVQIRVYSTQSTHKSLSCLRQGSMIHVYDERFEEGKESFNHAFMAHSTTSPNYQIIATMDLARRQAELEGFELVQHAIELAMIFRVQVNHHTLISKYFQAVGPSELIPEEFRKSKVVSGYDPEKDWGTVEKAWKIDEFVIDPTRVTLFIKQCHLNGFELKGILMDRFGIQINKASLTSILFQFNIGTLRSSVSYLLDSLFSLATELETTPANHSNPQRMVMPPDFSEFAPEFLLHPNISAGYLREAYYKGHDEKAVEYVPLEELIKRTKEGKKMTCAALVIPYPPGYPALVPGQVITMAILQFLAAIDPNTIVGYSSTQGIPIFIH